MDRKERGLEQDRPKETTQRVAAANKYIRFPGKTGHLTERRIAVHGQSLEGLVVFQGSLSDDVYRVPSGLPRTGQSFADRFDAANGGIEKMAKEENIHRTHYFQCDKSESK